MPRVCLIDDDILVRDAISLGLGDAGFEVCAAPGAASGLDFVKREGVDAVVTDMSMPGTNGAQFIAQVRELFPHLPLVAISGSSVIGGRDALEVAQEGGANAVMTKPFRASALAQVITDLLNESAAS
ncbi:MAG: response regulator [Proteobacteria bacterium]|nr:response regulator [Pseudomonadota bacterium]